MTESTTPSSEDYVFIEVGHKRADGKWQRNKLVRVDKYERNGSPDEYTTYMCFDESLDRHMDRRKKEIGYRSVSGFEGKALPTKVPVDFDGSQEEDEDGTKAGEPDIDKARKNAIAFIRRAQKGYDIPDGYFKIFFSGAKGFSLEPVW